MIKTVVIRKEDDLWVELQFPSERIARLFDDWWKSHGEIVFSHYYYHVEDILRALVSSERSLLCPRESPRAQQD